MRLKKGTQEVEMARGMQEKEKQINWKDLETIITADLGVVIRFHISTQGVRFVVTSNELKDCAGVMSGIFKTLTLENFGGGEVKKDKNNKKYLWLPIHFQYQYIKGGSNGSTYKTFTYWVDSNRWIENK